MALSASSLKSWLTHGEIVLLAFQNNAPSVYWFLVTLFLLLQVSEGVVFHSGAVTTNKYLQFL
jgi:hypothetical protein